MEFKVPKLTKEEKKEDKKVREFIRKNMITSDVLDFIPRAGTLQLFTIESSCIKEFERRNRKLKDEEKREV